jgi:hypothetical protein
MTQSGELFYNILIEMGTPMKPVGLIKMLSNELHSKVHINKTFMAIVSQLFYNMLSGRSKKIRKS